MFINELLNPKNIAIVGVSSDVKKLGTVIYNNIIENKYLGDIFLVNPKYDSLFNHKVYKNLNDINQIIDLAIIAIPGELVLDLVKKIKKDIVKNLCIISAGFSEKGLEGLQTEKELLKIAQNKNIKIIGPNTLGIISNQINLNASFANKSLPPLGKVSIFSQSGAFNTSLMDIAQDEFIGISSFLSIGNKIDYNENDFLNYFVKDANTDLIASYIEEFEDGLDFIKIVEESTKPIIILKSGLSKAGEQAANSHTGSIAGDSKSIETALKQSNAVVVYSIDNMISNLKVFSTNKNITTNKCAIVTNAGGPGIVLTDLISKNGLEIASISESTTTQLKTLLPESASVNNPIDILGDADSLRYENVLKILEQDTNFDILFVLLTPQFTTEPLKTAESITNLKSNKLIIPIFIGSKSIDSAYHLLNKNKFPAFKNSEEAVKAVFNFVKYNQRKLKKHFHFKQNNIISNKYNLGDYISDKETALPEELVRKLSNQIGLELPSESLIKDFSEAINFIKLNSFPVVLKTGTKSIAHKTEKNAVFTNINSELELLTAFNSLRKLTNDNLIIQKHVLSELEIFIGAKRDGNASVYDIKGKGFGHTIIFGQGGIYTEIFNDFAYRLIPISDLQITEMISETKISKIISGYRNKPALAFNKIVKTIKAIQTLLTNYPEISSLDLNPVLVTKNSCICVDIKIFTKS